MTNSKRKAVGTPARPSKAEERTEIPRQSGRVEIFINGVRVEVPPELEAAVQQFGRRSTPTPERHEVPPKLEAAVQRAYRGMLEPLPKEMTTTRAADFLDVSRPFVIKLVKRGELPCRMVGKHRRIPTDALLEYREKMFQRARKAAAEITRLSQEMEFHEMEGPPPKGQ